MEFDLRVTAGLFVALIAVGFGGLFGMDVMAQETLFMMVLPSMVLFGLICAVLGVKHGEFRATN
jgi:ABC-type dipeptide/oligopeptide/nickel transport system permease subunit